MNAGPPEAPGPPPGFPGPGCDISVIGAATKVHDEALGTKLGEICNKLFALN